MKKYTFENVSVGERDQEGNRFVKWTFCVNGFPAEESGEWTYGWKTDAEIALFLKKRLREAKATYELSTGTITI